MGTNEQVITASGRPRLTSFIHDQQENWIGHCARAPASEYIKTLTFHSFFKDEKQKYGVLDSTYRQVINRGKANGVKQKQIHENMMKKHRYSTDTATMFK